MAYRLQLLSGKGVAYTVIRSVWVSAIFCTCTVVSVDETLVEDKMRRFKSECAHFSFNKCPNCTHDDARAKFSTNSQETNNSVPLAIRTVVANCKQIGQVWPRSFVQMKVLFPSFSGERRPYIIQILLLSVLYDNKFYHRNRNLKRNWAAANRNWAYSLVENIFADSLFFHHIDSIWRKEYHTLLPVNHSTSSAERGGRGLRVPSKFCRCWPFCLCLRVLAKVFRCSVQLLCILPVSNPVET